MMPQQKVNNRKRTLGRKYKFVPKCVQSPKWDDVEKPVYDPKRMVKVWYTKYPDVFKESSKHFANQLVEDIMQSTQISEESAREMIAEELSNIRESKAAELGLTKGEVPVPKKTRKPRKKKEE
jgi:hypothetical protein